MSNEYEFHPLADRFPLMSADEFESLKTDIKENGLLEPICLFQGKILDGRNRYRACQKLGVKPKFRKLEMSASEAADFSVSQNLQRRHLTKSQQAMYIVSWGLLEGRNSPGAKRRYRTGESAIRRIGKRYGISHVSIYKAIFVYENDNELAEKVLKGDLSVAKAETIIRDREKESQKAICDCEGRRVPWNLKKIFRFTETFQSACAQLNRVRNQLKGLPHTKETSIKKAQDYIQLAISELESRKPHKICSTCSGRGCTSCGGRGWQSLTQWRRAKRP
jgi:hypothetical protein